MADEPETLAGFGAEEVATRASRRAARIRHELEIGEATDEAARARLEAAERRLRNYSQGAEGERLVAFTLGFLAHYGWVVLHDVRWPGRKRANIDHVAVGPGGVVIIDAKNWTGDVGVRDGILRQNGYSRAAETAAVADATAAVAALLAPEHRTATRAVLALVAQDQESQVLGATTVVGRSHLTELLLELPARLSAYEVADIARFLAGKLTGDRSPELMTTAYLDAARTGRPGARCPSATVSARRTQPTRGRPAQRRGRGGARRAVSRALRILLVLVAGLILLSYLPQIAEGVGSLLATLLVPEVPAQVPTPVPSG